MELRQLRHFQEIVRCMSFGQAAEKLNITQPALSKSIRNLEMTLGVKLLERHPSGVVPTPYGAVLLEYGTLVITELERAVEELNQMKGRGKGVVRVGAGATIMQYLLPRAVHAFIETDAAASVTFRQGLREDLLALLRRGEIDLVVGSINPDHAEDDLRQEQVMEDRLAVVAAEGHPLLDGKTQPLEAVARYRWVLPDTSESEGNRLTRAFRDAGIDAPACVVRTSSSVFMATMLKGTDYLSYLPAALIRIDPEYSHLRVVPLATPVWSRVTIGVTYRQRGVMLMPTRRFINRLLDVGRDLQAEAFPTHADRLA